MNPTKQVWDWRSYIIHYAPDIAPYRHLLLTLSCYMDSAGGSCFPSIKTLIQATSLSRPTVVKYLQKAEEDGWIKRSVHGFSGQGWKRNEYTASIPAKVLLKIQGNEGPEPDENSPKSEQENDVSGSEKAVKEVNHVNEGGKRPLQRRLTSFQKVVKEVNSISPYTSSVNSPEKDAPAESPPDDFTRLNNCPVPEAFQYKEFITEYTEFMDYMLEEKQVNITPRKTERHIQDLFRLKQQGNDPVRVIRQTIMSDNKSFYPLREKQFESKEKETGNLPMYQEV